ncbi:PID-CTERM protein-sorting domain-containing protein [Parasediminibacterium paludis]|uniref:PID-CTERM protein-sorting domain-containing protein n=1 Tax=Parasediminibacterium paludis TaxID=908966 RepID=A0ABV8PU39_9BACT
MKKQTLFIYLAMFVSILMPLVALAQVEGTDPDAPIDGGLSLLVMAGAGYGIKKLKEKRVKQEK